LQRVEERTSLSVFKVAATYIGTVVGAGFASGQEVMQFFSHFGINGLWGLLLATTLFGVYGWAILELGMKLNARSHLEVIRYVGGRWLGSAVDYVITFFLFGAFTAMAAGAGAIFAEQFQWPSIVGSGIMVVITLLTVMLGLNGVINSISLMVPLLIGSVFGIGIWTVIATKFYLNPVIGVIPVKAAVPFWPFSAVIYVSYNIVMAVAVLAPLGARFNRPDILLKGGILGGAGLGLGALAIFLGLAPYLPLAAKYQIPMIFVAGKINPVLRMVYSLVLLAEIYTTAVGSLYGFVARLTSPEGPMARYFIIGASAGAFLASQLGFTTMVRTLYPSVGYAGLLLLAGLTYYLIKRGKVPGDQAGY